MYRGAMPKKRLTLSVEEAVIERAKRFSRRHKTSISRLVTDFLGSLEDASGDATPVVDRLTGVIPSTASREDYRRHLDEKYG